MAPRENPTGSVGVIKQAACWSCARAAAREKRERRTRLGTENTARVHPHREGVSFIIFRGEQPPFRRWLHEKKRAFEKMAKSQHKSQRDAGASRHALPVHPCSFVHDRDGLGRERVAVPCCASIVAVWQHSLLGTSLCPRGKRPQARPSLFSGMQHKLVSLGRSTKNTPIAT